VREKPETIIADVGLRIAEARRAKGWTQQDAADHLGMEVQSWQRIERGTNLTIRSMVKIAAVLGVTTKDFFEPPTSQRKAGRPKRTA
jgi:transcriptional regulator with XRE-family HTH domain